MKEELLDQLDPRLEGQGICIQERTLITFPDGSQRVGQIWQHTHGIRLIYAIAPNSKGIDMPYAIEASWKVQTSSDGGVLFMAMGSDHWLSDLWVGLKVLLTKGRTHISKRNLA